MKNVAVLGATGSIGASALEVIGWHSDRFRPWAIAARASWEPLPGIVETHRPAHVVMTDEAACAQLKDAASGWDGTALHAGEQALCDLAAADEVDVVLVGISGAAGLAPTLAAARAGKRIALANKESLVMAGPILRQICDETGAELLPVDSEHSAIFQALASGAPAEVGKLILTASGGAFRELSAEQLQTVTPEDALRHPTWDMGAKITIDSAGLLNKALEVIEARWLFDVPVEQIDVVVHPQSIVHSMVEWVDGSVIAQLSLPDMKLPIQYALTYPERLPGPKVGFDAVRYGTLTFHPPDTERFPGLTLGFDAARDGGTMGAVLNAANEVAAGQFLAGQIAFPEISRRVAETMARHDNVPAPDLGEVMEADRWAREEVLRCRT